MGSCNISFESSNKVLFRAIKVNHFTGYIGLPIILTLNCLKVLIYKEMPITNTQKLLTLLCSLVPKKQKFVTVKVECFPMATLPLLMSKSIDRDIWIQ